MTTVVVGLGGMGSAALYHLARRGESVCGIEQFGPAHAHGASHGRSRVIRQAYFEDERYVPLLKRAYELWEDLNARALEPVWTLCGGLAIGTRTSALIDGNLRSARMHGVGHELLTPQQAMRRFPAFVLDEDEVAVYEPTVGALFPERCVAEHLRAAIDCGATARFGVTITAIRPHADHVEVALSDGSQLRPDRIILTAGPWITDFLPYPVRVERNVQHWFETPATATPNVVFMAERERWPRLLYGFPDFGGGVKAAFHHSGDYLAHASAHDEQTVQSEIETVRTALRELLAAPLGAHVRSEPCMYAVTPDEHFIIGASERDDRVIVAAGFSGHGFKFCSVVGEVLAGLACEGRTSYDITLFDPRRFANGAAPQA